MASLLAGDVSAGGAGRGLKLRGLCGGENTEDEDGACCWGGAFDSRGRAHGDLGGDGCVDMYVHLRAGMWCTDPCPDMRRDKRQTCGGDRSCCLPLLGRPLGVPVA